MKFIGTVSIVYGPYEGDSPEEVMAMIHADWISGSYYFKKYKHCTDIVGKRGGGAEVTIHSEGEL